MEAAKLIAKRNAESHMMEELSRLDQEDIQLCIEEFSLDEALYRSIRHPNINIKNPIGNSVLIRKGGQFSADLKINFANSVNCCVFLGEGVSGKIDIFFRASGSVVYIGSNAALQDLQIVMAAPGSRMLVGAGVTTSGFNRWIANSTSSFRDVLIGDDCMFSAEITVRNSDGHPVYDTETWTQSNLATRNVVIEPHCWIGRGSSVLKNVKIGACSIVAMGAVVTKTSDRFSVLAGLPAKSRAAGRSLWTRGPGHDSKIKAYEIARKFGSTLLPPF